MAPAIDVRVFLMNKVPFSERMLLPVKMFLARRMRDCKSTVPVLGEMLDRKLPLSERLSIRLHLFTCKYCTRYFEQIKFLRDAMRKQAENAENSPDRLRPEIKERLKEILRERVDAAEK